MEKQTTIKYIYDEHDVEHVLLLIGKMLPDRTNPRNEAATCLYTGPEGDHCLVGHVLTVLGLPLPTPDGGGWAVNAGEFGTNFTPEANRLLNRVQQEADSTHYDGAAMIVPNTWAYAIGKVVCQ